MRVGTGRPCMFETPQREARRGREFLDSMSCTLALEITSGTCWRVQLEPVRRWRRPCRGRKSLADARATK
eukprot:3221392-Rhodomonas_salina.4